MTPRMMRALGVLIIMLSVVVWLMVAQADDILHTPECEAACHVNQTDPEQLNFCALHCLKPVPDPGVPSPAPTSLQCGPLMYEAPSGKCWPTPSALMPQQLNCKLQGALVPDVYMYYECIIQNERLNWQASVDYIDYLEGEVEALRNPPVAPTPAGPDCDRTVKWGGGHLWKPVSENTGRPVILFAKDWCGDIAEVRITDAVGAGVASAKPRHGHGVCNKNGNREHWDVSDRASSLPAPSVLVAELFTGERLCFPLPDPTRRYE